MTQEKKAKRYDDLLVKLQEAKVDNNVCDERYCCVIDDIIPELRECEGERIRKSIIELLNEVHFTFKHYDINKMLAWLENQDKHDIGISETTKQKLEDNLNKPAWSEEDEENFKYLVDEIVCLGNSRNSANRLYYDRLIKFIGELKDRAQPREEWCETDERKLDRLIAYFEDRVAFTDKDDLEYAEWLKSLKRRVQPKSTWKPSDEQMKILNEVLNFSANHESPHWNDYIFGTLNNLIRQLKKLMED